MNCDRCGSRMDYCDKDGGCIWICPKCGHKVVPVIPRPYPDKPKIEKRN